MDGVAVGASGCESDNVLVEHDLVPASAPGYSVECEQLGQAAFSPPGNDDTVTP